MDRSSGQVNGHDMAGVCWGAKPIRPFAKEVAADLALVAFTSIATRTSSGTVWVLGPHHINTHLTCNELVCAYIIYVCTSTCIQHAYHVLTVSYSDSQRYDI